MTVATSQNGWRANDRSLIASYSIPNDRIAVRKGDVATILVYVAKRFHSEVERLVKPGNWGYAERPIRGSSTTLSNHASGTAIDLNAPRHPLGKRGTFSKKQVRAIKRILADCGGVVRWGGSYVSRADEMHFEINAGTARVRQVAQAIRAGKKPGPSGGASASGGSGTKWKTVKHGDLLKKGTQGAPVKEWQQKALGYTGKKADGYFGDGTEADTKKIQRKYNVEADGKVGKDTWPLRLKEEAARKKAKPKAKPKPKPKPFPLNSNHWFGPESRDSRNHSGFDPDDRPAIKSIQAKLGVKQTGRFDAATKKAVEKFQRKARIRVDGGVGKSTWAKLF